MANNYVDLPEEGGGGGGGVTSLNGETGAVDIVAGSGISVTPSGSNITIANTAGAPAPTQLVYVSIQGSDVSGTGSVVNPYATIAHAMASITDASDTKIYGIMLTPGTYSVNGLVINPDILIIGNQQQDTFLDFGSTGVTYSTFAGTLNPVTGFYNFTALVNGSLTGSVTITLPPGDGSQQSINFYLSNSYLSVGLAIQGGNSSTTYYINSYGNNYQSTGASPYFGSIFTGSYGYVVLNSINDTFRLLLTVDAAFGSGSSQCGFGCSFDGGTYNGFAFVNNLSSTGNSTNALIEGVSAYGSQMTIDGTTLLVYATATAFPGLGYAVFSNGAVDGVNLIRATDGTALRFYPDQPQYWPTLLSVSDALNSLADGTAKPATVNINGTQTAHTGSTSGTAVWSMPFQGISYKKFMIDLQALSDAGGTITYPTAFSTQPHLYGDTAAVAVSSTNTTTFTLSATAGVTGNVFVEGY